MRRVEEFLAEKMAQGDFAEAFWAAESEHNIAQQISTVYALRALGLAELLSLPRAQANDATKVMLLPVRALERSAN